MDLREDMMSTDRPNLNAAYALKTPGDSQRLYRQWADTYDTSFARDQDYVYPMVVAEVFAEYAPRTSAKVLDVGAGTGLVGAALSALGDWQVDGVDISPEMLSRARAKGHYRALFTGDLTNRLDRPDGSYDALLSAGTFTHGHLGPEVLDELLRIARKDALFVLGVNKDHFSASGFPDKLAALASQVADTKLVDRKIYGPNAAADHRDDLASIVVFRKT